MTICLDDLVDNLKCITGQTQVPIKTRIETATEIIRELISNPQFGETNLQNAAETSYRNLVKDKLDDFQEYIPVALEFLTNVVDMKEAKYWGHIYGRKKEGKTTIPPHFSLKVAYGKGNTELSSGQLTDSKILLDAINEEMKTFSRKEFEATMDSLGHNIEKERERDPLFESINGLSPEKRICSIIAPLRLTDERGIRNHGIITFVGEKNITKKEFALMKSLLENQLIPDLNVFSKLRKDDLTGLYKQEHRFSILESELLKAKKNNYPLSIISIDIDHFGKFNNDYGHPEGDELLKSFGKLLIDNSRPTDRWIRNGGEEFLGYAPKTDYDDAKNIFAENLRKIIETTRFIGLDGEARNITASLGVYTIELMPDNRSALKKKMMFYLQASDEMLYKAKNDGRNCVR